MNKYIIITTLSIFILNGCSPEGGNKHIESKSIHKTDTINIELDRRSNYDFSSDFSSDLQLIKLELTANSLLNEFDLYKYYNGRYYVHSNQENSIVCFDSNGRYMYQIHRPGKGKGEYVDIRYFEFDTDRDALFILDMKGNRIIYYDLQQGDFLSDGIYINKISSIYRIHGWEYIYSGYSGHKIDYVTLFNLHLYNLKKPSETSKRFFPILEIQIFL